jgi:hypothetical protein
MVIDYILNGNSLDFFFFVAMLQATGLRRNLFSFRSGDIVAGIQQYRPEIRSEGTFL